MYKLLNRLKIYKFLQLINELYYYLFDKKYYAAVKSKAVPYYVSIMEEIRGSEEYSALMKAYVQPTWQGQLEQLSFSEKIPLDFLLMPMSRRMFYKTKSQVDLFREDIAARKLEDFDDKKTSSFKEPRYGLLLGLRRTVSMLGVRSVSPNMAVMLYYWAIMKSRHDLSKVSTIAEFGGGYGNLALLAKREMPGLTYIIFDLPEMLALQYCFLSAIFGEDGLNINSDKIEKGKINLVPVHRMNRTEAKVDLLVSTFALTEASVACQDDMAKKDYFGADFAYIVGHESTEGPHDMWDSIERTKGLIEQRFKNVTMETFPQKDCFHIFAKDNEIKLHEQR